MYRSLAVKSFTVLSMVKKILQKTTTKYWRHVLVRLRNTEGVIPAESGRRLVGLTEHSVRQLPPESNYRDWKKSKVKDIKGDGLTREPSSQKYG